jgi:hypothetical protein
MATAQHGECPRFELELWEKLNSLITTALAEGGENRSRDAIVSMFSGGQVEIAGLLRFVEEIASSEPDGYLAAKLEENNHVAAAWRRLRWRIMVVD